MTTLGDKTNFGPLLCYPESHPVFGLASTPYPHFQWYPQRKEILIYLNMKCWNSAFNAQGSRVIVVVVQVGAVKVSVATVEEPRKKERQDEI
jgi:hypothetical protein